MPIDLDALLQPISAEEPAGADIRYHAVTKKLREARRQEDDISQGVWKTDVKVADYQAVLKLAPEVLTKQSKDLQVAAWLTEALVRTEGFSGLRQGLELIRGLLERFWDTVYPQPDEDGDLEIRSAALRWAGSQLDGAVKASPLLKTGIDWYQYKSSRSVPLEEESHFDPQKQEARQEAIAAGATMPEEVAAKLSATPYEFLRGRHAQIQELIEYIDSLSEFCDAKFGASAPEFNPLKASLEEVLQTARVLMKQKGEPDPQPFEAGNAEPPQAFEDPSPASNEYDAVPQQRRSVAPAGAAGPEPASLDDAVAQLRRLAGYMRREWPANPVPYLMVRALRWGELRANGSYPDSSLFEAPPTDIRVELKRLASEGNWEQLRETAENAAGLPCGRVWLDLQRYAVQANRNCGLDAVATAILSGVRSLLADYPELPAWSLVDDTPAANPDTRNWLESEGLLQAAPPGLGSNASFEAVPEPAPQVWSLPEIAQPEPESGQTEMATPDPFHLALDAARDGRFDEAVSILSREIAHESSERGRFLRRTQLAQLALAAGRPEMGRPLLQQSLHEIGARGLEQWEEGELLSEPMALLYQCMNGEETAERRDLYARICRIDPPRALRLTR